MVVMQKPSHKSSCQHKYRIIKKGQYTHFNQFTGRNYTGNYYDQECEHCGEIRQIRK